MSSLLIITDAGNNLNVRRRGANWGDYRTPLSGILRSKEQATLCVLVWDGCQDVLLRSANAVGILCTTIWVLKSEICLYVREIFWKDTKGAVNSGMPLKKDTGDWMCERGEETYFSLYTLLCSYKKMAFFFFFYYVHALSFRLKRT